MPGKGAITNKNGKYYLVLSKGKVGTKYHQKWVQLKAKTKNEAEDERDFIYTDRKRGVWVEPNKITVSQYNTQFLVDMKKAVEHGRTAEATYEWYEKRIRLHINPVIGGLKFNEVKARDLQNLYDVKFAKSPNMAEAVYRILHAVWAEAVRDDDLDIKYNLADKIHHGEKEKYIPETWTGEQITYFLLNAKKHRYYEVFLLGFGAGMRLGEILGLTWDRIDHKNMVIDVKRSITLNKPFVLDLDHPELLFKKNKTASSVRSIRMIPIISDALKELRRKQAAEELAAKTYYKFNLIFATEDGRPVNYSNLRENYWLELINQLSSEEKPLSRMKLHGMRHSCATWLYEMGVPVEIIQDILGHSIPLITKQLYVHPTVKAQDKAMDLIWSKFKEAGL